MVNLPKNVTFRQFDHWVRKGLIEAKDSGLGPGSQRYLTATEEQVLKVMGDLVADGVTPARASEAARALTEYGYTQLGGFWLFQRRPTERESA